MLQSTEKLIPALWPLPGGNGRYLETLDQILQWATTTPEPSRDKFNAWMASQYNAGKSASGYLQVVLRLGVLESRDGSLAVTSLGKRILTVEGEAKAKVVIDRFMRDYLAFPEMLAFYVQANEPVHLKDMAERLRPQFPQWTSEAQFDYRALWLLSLGCLRQVKGRYYEATEFGKSIAALYPPAGEVPVPMPGPDEEEDENLSRPEPPIDEVTQLIGELEAAATAGQAPERLERAVAEAFEFLGFAVDQLGGPGDTDVLVRANIGPESYAVVVDAKARGGGKLQNLDTYALRDHMQQNQADYAVVVAGSFADGRLVRQARDNQVVLLGVQLLAAWLRLHARTPLNLSQYRAMFSTPGPAEGIPTTIKSAAEKQEQRGRLLVDLMELMQETYNHGLDRPWPTNQMFAMLVARLRGVRYAEQEVQDAVALLLHPAVGAALGSDEAGISLAMSRQTLARVFRTLADQIEATDIETQG